MSPQEHPKCQGFAFRPFGQYVASTFGVAVRVALGGGLLVAALASGAVLGVDDGEVRLAHFR
jgi:hypothetical protein